MKNNKENSKTNFIGNMKASFSGRKFRSGAYATMLSVVVIVIVLVVNMLVSKMNIQFDLTSQSMYSLTSDTKTLLKGLNDDITIYYMVQQGSEKDEFMKIAKLYDSSSSKVTLVEKDPVLYPTFAAKYVDDTVTANSFIVVNNTNNTAKYIPGSDMVVTQMNYQTYQSETTGIDVEGELTSAIQFVTNKNLPIMYVVDGHGETATSDTFSSAVKKMNIDIKTLSTLTQSAIPKDCNILYINAPTNDFNDAETTMIKDYLTAGGKAIITLNYNASSLPNFLSILDYYGVEVVNGTIIEGDANKYVPNRPDIFVPTIESHDITSKVKGSNIAVFMLTASGLNISDTKRSSLTVTPLLTTSDSSFSKVNFNGTVYDKQDGDINGPFNVGLVATDTYNNVTSDLVVFSSADIFSDDTADYGNADLLTGTVGYLSGDTSAISIPAKSYGIKYITTTQLQAIMWGVVTVIVIPVTVLIIGGVICYRRRRK